MAGLLWDLYGDSCPGVSMCDPFSGNKGRQMAAITIFWHFTGILIHFSVEIYTFGKD